MNLAIINFFHGTLKTPQGISIDDCINATDLWLEYCHTYIQWCFPLKEPSLHNSQAPILDDDTISFIKYDKTCMENIKKISDRMFNFYKSNPIKNSVDHNCLRMTRILNFLHTIDLEYYNKLKN